jgi:4-amino-4-deoxy-L-arabinose transferase-like glycosyltransferase
MLLLAALALTAVFRLARLLTNSDVAIATVLCTAMYPIWFTQSSLAHADLPAAAFLLWALFFYFRSILRSGSRQDISEPVLLEPQQRRTERVQSLRDETLAIIFFSIAGLCKETAVIVPIALVVYALVTMPWQHHAQPLRASARSSLLLLSATPLALWYWYHHHVTGFAFGNPEFFAYNVTGTLTPLRVLLSFLIRLWQAFGYMNLWLLTLATLWVMRYPPLYGADKSERPRILLAVQYRIAAIIVANLLAFSVVGGAALARYLLPIYPLVILIGVSTLRRRLPEWKWAVSIVLLGFAMALFSNPFGYIPPEDNLSYRDYVILHKEAAAYLQIRDPRISVLTAWTATDELTKPFLGYIRQPMRVVRIENFSYDQLQLARQAPDAYDLALLFSTKQEPSASLLDHWPWAQRMSRRYFGFHRDLPPEVAAGVLGGRVTWERRRGMQWIAVVTFDRVENARKERIDERRKTHG